ncbi:MAG: hypothetical protein IKT43_00455, partial [Clostridia bacterium]|nr:hypothetical protein [Clostridia bacterium]
MNTKRILALVLGIMMMLPLALNGFAYSSPYQSLQTTSTATSKVTISGSSLNFDLFGTANVTPGTKTATASITDEKGALHLNNTGTTNLAYTTGNKGSANTSNQYSNFVSPTNGMTFDLYAKFKNLPKITSSTVMKDTGVVSGNPSNVYFSGLVFNLASAEKYMADTSKANNELQAVFAYYDNATLGTNTVLILPYGNRNSFGSAPAVCYFFNTSQSSYDRYTLTFDPVSKTTQFFINGVAQKANGTGSTTFGSVALCYRTTATVNFLNINLNNAQAGVSANNGTYKANVFIDQLNVYPTALVPNTTDFGFEGDPVPAVENQQMKDAKAIYDRLNPVAADYYNPTFWNAFKGWIDYCYNIVNNGGDQATLDAACTGTSGNWFINRLGWRTTAGKDATSGGSSVTVAGTGVVLPAATPIAVNVDRIALSHSVYNGTTDAYAWTNSAFIWTKAGMRMSDYKAYNNNLNNVAEYDEWYALKCLPTKAAGIYRVSELGKNCDLDVPEGGFLVVVYADGGFANNILLNSTKTSDQFAIRNYHAINALNLQKDDYVRLENVTLNEGAAATLSTSGTWYCVGDSRIPSGTGKSDYFSNFKTASCLVKVDETTLVPDTSIKLTVAGTGSVSAKVDGTAVA